MQWFRPTLPAIVMLAGIAFLAVAGWWEAPSVYRTFLYLPPIDSNVSFAGYTPAMALALAAGCFATGLLGWATARPLFHGLAPVSTATQVAASFSVGYVALAGLLRLVSLTVSLEGLFVAGLVTSAAATAAAFWLSRESAVDGRPGFPTWINIPVALGFAGLVAVALVLQVFQGDFRWAGHLQYVKPLGRIVADQLAHFPIIMQQYDEMIHAQFLTARADDDYGRVIAWWITLALNKVSVTAMVYVFCRHFVGKPLEAMTVTAFVIAGTTSLLPDRLYLLFSNGNPILHEGFSTTIAGFGVLLLLLLASPGQGESDKPGLPVWAWAVLGLGLSATMASNAVWAVTLCLLLPLAGRSLPQGSPLEGGLAVTVLMCSVAACLLLYGLPFEPRWAILARLAVVGGIVALAAWQWGVVLLRNRWRPGALGPAAILATAALAGFALLGNIFVDTALARAVNDGMKAAGIDIVFRPINILVGITGSGRIGDFRELRMWAEYSQGIGHFAAYYGAVLALLLYCGHLVWRRRSAGTALSGVDRWIVAILTICAASLPPILFFVDFVDMAERAFLKTKFLEIPVYLSVCLGLLLVLRLGGQTERRAALALAVAYVVVPTIATERIDQWLANLELLRRML